MLTTANSQLSAYRHFASTDVDDVRDRVAEVYCQHRLDPVEPRRPLAAWQNIARLSRVGVATMGYGAEVRIDPGRLETFFLLMLPYAGSAAIETGHRQMRSDRGRASVLSPTDSIRMTWSADCAKATVRIDRDGLEQQLAVLLDRPLREPLRFDPEMPMAGRGAAWWRYVGLMIDELDRQEAHTPPSATLQQLEGLLLTNLLETQPHNYSEAMKVRGPGIAPAHVRRVERFIEEHVDEPLDMATIVAASGVSARTLYEGFQRFRDRSPMAYIRIVRMQRVREDLTSATVRGTVADIAMRWGVYELGRFAGQYRKFYGESPSETLRRCRY
jgi:AraC-like DNA-binding protein